MIAASLPTVASAGSPRALRAPALRIVSFDPPPSWERGATPPSTRLLATWSHASGARLTLAAEHVAGGVTAVRVFDDSRASLEKQGWAIGKVERADGRVTVDAALDKGKRVARQAYVVEGGFVYVVTMVAPADQAADRGRDLDDAVRSLRLGDSDGDR